MQHSIVLPPSSNLAASPLHLARRVQRAHGLTAGVAVPPTSGLARSAYHTAAMSTVAAASTPVAAASAAAVTPLPSAPSMAHATAPAATIASATPGAPRQSMGLFAHVAKQSSSAHLLSSEERWDLGGRPSVAAGDPSPSGAELARVYAFLDEAQSRTVQLERQVEEQKETNRVLLISSSQQLIALQERADALLFENAQMGAELAQLTARNRQMVAQAQAQAQAQTQAQTQSKSAPIQLLVGRDI